jgi:hypothetical protein
MVLRIKALIWTILNLIFIKAIAVQMGRRFYSQDLDSANFVQLVHNNSNNKNFLLDSELHHSFAGYWRFIWQPTSYWCSGDFSSKDGPSIVETHPNFIAIPLHWLKQILNIDALNLTTYFFAVIIVIYINLVIYYLWKFIPNYIVKFLAIAAFLCYPPILVAIQGQIYFDKIIIFLGPLFVYYLYNFYSRKNVNYIPAYFLTLIVILISERAAIYVFITSSVFSLLTFKNRKNINFKDIVKYYSIPLISLSYFLVWYFQIQNSLYYSSRNYFSYGTLRSRYESLKGENLQEFFFPFLIFTLPIIIVVFYANYVLGILALLLILPNIFINIGGAELTGYLTHYHSLYAGTIWILLALSLQEINEKSKNSFSQNFSITILSVILLISTLAYYQTSLLRNLKSIYTFENQNEFDVNKVEKIKKIMKSLPENKKISMHRNLMPFFSMLSQDEIGYFPVLLNEADIVLALRGNDQKLIIDTWNLRDPENIEVVQECFDLVLSNYTYSASLDLGTASIYIYSKTVLDLVGVARVR